VTPLGAEWRDGLDAIARRRFGLGYDDLAAVAERVSALSEHYNHHATPATGPDRWLARLLFSFPRDVPKAGAALGAVVRDLPCPLRMLDIGAGLGAMTVGVTRALRTANPDATVEATWIDIDREAMAIGIEAAALQPGLAVSAPDREAALSERYDLVVVGQVLSELDPGTVGREDRHAAWIRGLVRHQVVAGGVVLVIEPGLRERTRHLMAIRDRVVARGVPVRVPCPHDRPCPMLPNERDWCHQEAAIELPSWLVPLAREAGLRRERLTWASLILGGPPREPGWNRVVSAPLVSKGKREVVICTSAGELERVARLDRHASPVNAPFEDLERGDRVRWPGAARVRPEDPVERG
jgi:ribosomal protein RSM22 (predicted rRNA methylase)